MWRNCDLSFIADIKVTLNISMRRHLLRAQTPHTPSAEWSFSHADRRVYNIKTKQKQKKKRRAAPQQWTPVARVTLETNHVHRNESFLHHCVDSPSISSLSDARARAAQKTSNMLTYSMVQSPSWEANWFAASQEIPRILWNPNVHYLLTYLLHGAESFLRS